MGHRLYYPYSEYLKELYGEKVYKLPVKLALTCPNRDGRVARGGCAFCGEEGGSFENRAGSIAGQLVENRNWIEKKYKARRFIAYFQNFTNTYLPREELRSHLLQVEKAGLPGLVAVAISTRPDCLPLSILELLKDFQETSGLDVIVEIGVQSFKLEVLEAMNRGHGMADSIGAILRCKEAGLRVSTHMMIGYPKETREDVVEAARLLSHLKVDDVKCHALYILRKTALGEAYERGEISMISKEEYLWRISHFLAHLHPEIAIQRLTGRAPEEDTLFCNWGMSWWKLRDEIHGYMNQKNLFQGSLRCIEEGLTKS